MVADQPGSGSSEGAAVWQLMGVINTASEQVAKALSRD